MKRIAVKNIDACSQCGSCVDACSTAYYKQAFKDYASIRISQNSISVCTQCGLCAQICPVECITTNKFGVYMIDKKACLGCSACMDICPEGVIVKALDRPTVTKCSACGLCVKACPNGVLEVLKD